ncbi:MAG TPA: sugar transferase [Nitrospiraceae bacterium]|nr:sugar transferase [Nitrospiraceae bacterium]
MLKERAKELATIVAILDMALLGCAFFAAILVRNFLLPLFSPDITILSISRFLWLLGVSVPTFYVLFRATGVYDSVRTKSMPELIGRVAKPTALGGLFLGFLIFVVQAKYFSRSLFAIYLGLFFLFVTVAKILIRLSQKYIRVKGFNYRNVLIVGVNEEALRIADALGENREFGFRVAGMVGSQEQEYSQVHSYKILGTIQEVESIIDKHIIDEIIFALPLDELPRCEKQIMKCEEVGIKIHIRANFAHSIFARTYLSRISDIPILTLATTPHSAGDILIKRLLDVALSASLLILFAPVMAITAVLVRFDSKGPVLFRQIRCGLSGRRFVLLKFRSMVHDAEHQRQAMGELNEVSGPVFKIRNDPRVTRFGSFLRKTSLDELPQLWNVFLGDMSLVGPRPPLPSEVQKYERWQRRRLSMKPGITCLWQVNGRSRIGFDEWMKLDMEYIDNWSLTLDLKILARTIPAVLFTRGAH